tara:strand:+ start:194180 stop:197551 length:3372 start_codon:yes stop_codon:yes gene_type:complete
METYGLENVKTFDQLLPWLNEQLTWPIDEASFQLEDVTYEWDAVSDLGLKQGDIAHIREIQQLQPLVTNQPWGIFFISFEDKKIPIGVLKRVLGGLTRKKRESANKAEQKGWAQDDLLFISAHGKSGEREMSFLHFSRDPENQNKTVLKELGWDKNETITKLSYVAGTLKEKLVWPDDHSNADDWREKWSSAFSSRHGAAISTAKALTKQLGTLATNIRYSINEILSYESKSGPLTKTFENFKDTIFHNLDHDDFADMYAQTICYGLLSARLARASGALVADDATLMADVVTHPFLKDLMGTFLALGGSSDTIDFNELGIDEVVDFLSSADMEAVKRDFNNKNPDEDTVLHFYEHFLKEYDSIMRQQRGVYYTPHPVVSFIVRSVDEILQKEFGLEDGLADISTWAEVTAKNPNIEIPEIARPEDPFVQILDPAIGTGTFLVEVIDLIERRMKRKWMKQGATDKEILTSWNDYVPKHLLTRLYGFELMMAPYSIAHIKIGMKLEETGYLPNENGPRLRVFLTNTLEEALNANEQTSLSFILESLAEEAKGADHLKSNVPISVIIGNPPYSNYGQLNQGHFIRELISSYKQGLDEKKINLDDAYIKFTRHAHNMINESGIGVFAMITNNSYLDGVTHRQMRKQLSEEFSKIYLYNLHGNSKQKETSLDGSKDENVFDIQQGVSIGLYIKKFIGLEHSSKIYSGDLFGLREAKFNTLSKNTAISEIIETLHPVDPFNFFVKRDLSRLNEFNAGISVTDLFLNYNTGIQTKRDALCLQPSHQAILQVKEDFLNLEAEEIRTKYNLVQDNRDWKIHLAKKDVANSKSNPVLISHRPFDDKWTLYTGKSKGFIGYPRDKTMKHMLNGENLALLTARQNKSPNTDHFFVTANISEMKCAERTIQSFHFPLFEFHEQFDGSYLKVSNIAKKVFEVFQKISPDVTDLELFQYIYSLLYSPSYRTRYSEYLKSEFPRIQIPKSKNLITKLAKIGDKLIQNHLLDYKGVHELPETRFINNALPQVQKGYPKYENSKVMINAKCHFEDITSEVWNFYIGGYQPLQKWLKDRAAKGGKNARVGRILTEDDILHYRRMTIAIRDTISLMAEVDDVINAHGGWPGAFVGSEENNKEI